MRVDFAGCIIYNISGDIMGKIKVILWDIDGTLLNFPKAEKCAIRKCFEIFNFGICSDEMLAEYSAINRRYWESLERGEIPKNMALEGRFKEFFSNNSLDTSVVPQFNKEYQLRLGDSVFPNDNAVELIKSLHGKVEQYAVTNGTKIAQQRKLSKSGLDKLFSEAFISEEVGFEKPMKEFFDIVKSKIGDYSDDEILIVGDSLTSDMQGGNNANIICCWYNPNDLPHTGKAKIDYEIKSLSEVADIIG